MAVLLLSANLKCVDTDMKKYVRRMNKAQCACELMRLLGRTRLLKPNDIYPHDKHNIQALVSILRLVPTTDNR
jgi:hypothetical protein